MGMDAETHEPVTLDDLAREVIASGAWADLKGSAKGVWLALAVRADARRQAWPELKELAREAGITTGTLDEALWDLRLNGCLHEIGRLDCPGGQAIWELQVPERPFWRTT